jgi:viologen exporter family transport system permease protein
MEVEMWNALTNYTRLVAYYLRANLKAQLEYRGAFISEALAMFINDGSWVAFWMLFFRRFPVLNGWDLRDVLTVWAISTAGFGIAHSIMGNGWHLATVIVNGQLDLWMLYPRPVLPHLLLGRTVATAWGDAAFGYVVYLAFVRPDATHLLMFVVLSFSVAAVFIGFSVLSASIAFFIGNAAVLCEQWRFAVITFSTYPQTLFSGFAKLMLFTAMPAAFVSYVPVEALRTLSIWSLAACFGGAVAVVAAGAGLFYFGLRRYESGNLLSMHG